ncbi:family 43 glycosylhydrolase [Agromyces intestinalis]|uniref:Family 43 glycosylhydrolase n=1 Tax=Agromyces intestinalis TaxID=2592652 RepID=A0A5C1YJZ7_9MICO|nr:family 43 glycosylhydrolase [Agromyces intestinalis]QEO15499.1 family 43 glycosylhydrolase [Agromyces intestinalis]
MEHLSNPRRIARRGLWRTIVATLAAAAVMLSGLVVASPAAAASTSFTNPFIQQRADPHIFKHTDGYYYMTATVPAYDRIVLRRATTLNGLRTAPETTIWTKHSSGEMGAHIWAPEIHFIDGKWYVYFAAGATNDIWAIRMYVLEGTGSNALTANWTEKGRIVTPWASFSLDATTFAHNGNRYLVWAQSESGIDSNSNLYIARMTNPWTITGTPVRIAQPTYDWEKRGHKVVEGAAVLVRNNRVFISYSASATDKNYAMGLLTASTSSNLLSASSWSKRSTPVFQSNASTGQWGPGHNSFTVDETGADVLVYHARNYENISGEPLNNPDRHTRLQRLYWNSDGTPLFGVPVPDGSFTFGDTPPSIFTGGGASGGERVTNRHSGLVLDVQNPNTSNGAKVGQYAWNGGAWQQWKFEDAGSGYVRIRSVHSNKCLDVAGTANGAEVQQYDCHTGTNQQFTLRSTSNGYVQIVDRRSGRCLDVPGWSTANGTIIKIYDCNNGNNQQWLRAAA